MKKTSFPLIALLFCCLLSAVQGHGQKWWFHGITISEKLGCANPVSTKYKHVWLPGDTSYTRKYKELIGELKAAHGYDYLVRPISVEPGERYLIALAAKTRRCSGEKARSPEVISYGYYFGATKENIQSQINSDLRSYTDLLKIEVKEYIPWEEELARLNPAKEKPKTFAMVDQGVNVTVKKNAGSNGRRTLLVTFHNTNKLKSAVIGWKSKVNAVHELRVLNSGATMRLNIDSNEVFNYFIHLGENRGETQEVYDKIKKWVQATIKGEANNPGIRSRQFSPACMCIRG